MWCADDTADTISTVSDAFPLPAFFPLFLLVFTHKQPNMYCKYFGGSECGIFVCLYWLFVFSVLFVDWLKTGLKYLKCQKLPPGTVGTYVVLYCLKKRERE